MVINPTRELTIDAYPDADFAGMYGHEKPTDPATILTLSPVHESLRELDRFGVHTYLGVNPTVIPPLVAFGEFVYVPGPLGEV
jgi:hypothetical protein